MTQRLTFAPTPHGSVAVATLGDGPPLVFPSWWVSHLELTWDDESLRRLLIALAEHHTVVRYDRVGTGLSARPGGDATLGADGEVEVLGAVLDHLGIDTCSLFGFSYGGCIAGAFAAAHPERVRRLVMYGTYATGTRIATEEARTQMVALVRRHWGVGSRVLASIFFPEGDAADLRAFSALQQEAASAETAARLLELVYAADMAGDYGRVSSPTLVLHRRDDRAIPYELGVETASLIPGAQLVPLAGSMHFPWRGDVPALLDAVGAFMHLGDYGLAPDADGAPAAEALSEREREILTLVAEGMADREIADRLVLSPHTVHRHVANIREKLGQPSRAAAAAAAARQGLI